MTQPSRSIVVVTTLVLATYVSAIAVASGSGCLPTCRFNLCKPSNISLYMKSDVPLTSRICLEGRRIGVVNTGEAYVMRSSGKFRPISRLSPRKLKQKFSPHFFKAYPLRSGKEKRNRGSGVGHEVPQQNQRKFLGGRCVALPVTHYQKLSAGNVVDNIHLDGSPLVDCVSFVVDPGARRLRPPAKPTSDPLPSTAPPSTTSTKPPATGSTEPPTTTLTEPGRTRAPTTTVPTTTVPKTTSPAVGTLPEFVEPGDAIKFPPSTKLNEKTRFKFNVTVSAESGSAKEDFYLLSDATGSMSSAIADAKERFMDVVKARQAASTDVAFGVGFYRDEAEDPDFSNVQPVTKNISAVNAAIDGLEAIGGGDFPEANLLALYEIATSDKIGWREGSRKILVYFGDAVGHEPSCVGDLVLRRDNVVAALNEKKITVVATSFSGDGLNSLPSAFGCPEGEEDGTGGQADAITAGTGGKLVDAEDQTELIESILSSVSGLSQSLDADVSDCEAVGVDVSFAPNVPLSIDAGKTVTVEETVKVSTCGGAGGWFECTVKFTLGGADIGMQTLSASALAGC